MNTSRIMMTCIMSSIAIVLVIVSYILMICSYEDVPPILLGVAITAIVYGVVNSWYNRW